ncbi:MAG: DinB family protein, partial [Chloroflexota bacterium]
WIIGHLANQEQRYWLLFFGREIIVPEVAAFGTGKPASTPPLDQVWQAWHTITQATDPFLDSLTTDDLLSFLNRDGKPLDENVGTLIHRVTYHYWYHTGESQAIRQLLGHSDLPTFVGDLGEQAPYHPEA